MHGLSATVHRSDRIIDPKYKEHIHAIKYNKDASIYAQHILNPGNSYGNMQNTMNIIQIT